MTRQRQPPDWALTAIAVGLVAIILASLLAGSFAWNEKDEMDELSRRIDAAQTAWAEQAANLHARIDEVERRRAASAESCRRDLARMGDAVTVLGTR